MNTMLYDRDYRILTKEEEILWRKAEDNLNKSKNNGIIASISATNKYYEDIPHAVLHYQQLFPNNYLNVRDLAKKEYENTVKEFEQIFESKISERDVLNFIRKNKAYFIVASILKSQHYLFGHHGAFAFKEFELPPNYLVDYLLIGKNSGGYEFIFVELENPYGQITTNNGEFGTTIRKGIKQLNDWDKWLEANYYSLRLVFDKYIGKTEQLPREFHEFDKSRMHFVVIAGRRKDFNENTYQLRRRLLKSNNILLLHYDNLFDSAKRLLHAGNY